MHLVLHIGIAEAAAALIQDSLAANADWLRARGMVYADLLAPTPNHITLFFACATQVHRLARDYGLQDKSDLAAFRTRLATHIDRQIAARPPGVETMVMASPALTGLMRREDEIAALHALLRPRFASMRVLVYVRRQDDATLLKYADLVRRGQLAAPFERFVETCLGEDRPMPHLDYRTSLTPWLRVWGPEALVVRRFSPTELIDGDILADVMGVLMQTWEPALQGFRPAPDHAPVLAAPALELLRQMQGRLPFAGKNGAPNPRRRALMPVINALPRSPRPIMAAATARQIMGQYRPANTWLKETFAPNLEGPFFPDRPDHPEHGNLGALGADEAACYAGQLLSAAS
ncbi:MAG: hypothetical protein AAGD12_16240 [Pseudomonadota bacterium]